MKKILPLLLLTPTFTNAECTPAPDCASIGYTQTSCETIYLKCPFDQSKLYCFPCDSVYQYSCSGNNITGGIGSSCNNKYAQCECVVGATFTNGSCVCDTSCDTIGNIYYTDGTCSSCIDNNKNVAGIIIQASSYIASAQPLYSQWSLSADDITSLPNVTSSNGALADYSGKSNTHTIATYYNSVSDTKHYPALHCYNYAPIGLESTKGEWYLPAYGELKSYFFSHNTSIIQAWQKLGYTLVADYLWSSTEFDAVTVWNLRLSDGYNNVANKVGNYFVTVCILKI